MSNTKSPTPMRDDLAVAVSEKPAAKAAVAPAKKLTPAQHAKALGLVEERQQAVAIVMKSPRGAPAPVPGKVLAYDWRHNCAAKLHGWAEHKHHAGADIELSAEDYAAALKAVEEPDAKGNYVPHVPALSPFKGLAI